MGAPAPVRTGCFGHQFRPFSALRHKTGVRRPGAPKQMPAPYRPQVFWYEQGIAVRAWVPRASVRNQMSARTHPAPPTSRTEKTAVRPATWNRHAEQEQPTKKTVGPTHKRETFWWSLRMLGDVQGRAPANGKIKLPDLDGRGSCRLQNS